MKRASNRALNEALALLQETAASPFLAEDDARARSQLAGLDELFLLNVQMRRRNLDCWIRLLSDEVDRRAQAVQERHQRKSRAANAPPRLRASA